MWKNQGSWNFFHTKLIPNSSNTCILFVQILCAVEGGSKFRLYRLPEGEHNYQEFSLEVEVPVLQTERGFVLTGY